MFIIDKSNRRRYTKKNNNEWVFIFMQIQKEEVKNKIIEAAVEEFLVCGYQQSSMRNIAEQAGITVGNIYSYFSGKEDLFECILESTIQELRSLIFIDISGHSPVSTSSIAYITQSIKKVFLGNRSQFLILMNGSTGSKYENTKGEVIKLAKQRLLTEVFKELPAQSKDALLADSLAVALIEGLLNMLNKYGGDEERLTRLIRDFLLMVLGDISIKG